MSFFDDIQMLRYKFIKKQIDELNKKNVKGYNTFSEYCVADEIMIGYFKKLKDIEKNYHC